MYNIKQLMYNIYRILMMVLPLSILDRRNCTLIITTLSLRSQSKSLKTLNMYTYTIPGNPKIIHCAINLYIPYNKHC